MTLSPKSYVEDVRREWGGERGGSVFQSAAGGPPTSDISWREGVEMQIPSPLKFSLSRSGCGLGICIFNTCPLQPQRALESENHGRKVFAAVRLDSFLSQHVHCALKTPTATTAEGISASTTHTSPLSLNIKY